MNKNHRYTEEGKDGWMETTRNYLIGRNPVLEPMLKWAEEQGEKEIDPQDVRVLRDTLGLMTDMEPLVASSGIWSFLNLNLVGCSNATNTFANVAKLNWLEAWRRLTAPIRKRTVAKQIRLRKKAWNPAAAISIKDFAKAVLYWETDYRLHREAQGAPIPDDQRREMLVGILPSDLSVAMMVETRKHGDYDSLKQFVSDHIQLLLDHGKRGGVNLVGEETENESAPPATAVAVGPALAGGDGEDVEECDLDPQQIIEVNALMARAGSNKRFVPKGGGQRAREQAARRVAGPEDLRSAGARGWSDLVVEYRDRLRRGSGCAHLGHRGEHHDRTTHACVGGAGCGVERCDRADRVRAAGPGHPGSRGSSLPPRRSARVTGDAMGRVARHAPPQ